MNFRKKFFHSEKFKSNISIFFPFLATIQRFEKKKILQNKNRGMKRKEGERRNGKRRFGIEAGKREVMEKEKKLKVRNELEGKETKKEELGSKLI